MLVVLFYTNSCPTLMLSFWRIGIFVLKQCL